MTDQFRLRPRWIFRSGSGTTRPMDGSSRRPIVGLDPGPKVWEVIDRLAELGVDQDVIDEMRRWARKKYHIREVRIVKDHQVKRGNL